MKPGQKHKCNKNIKHIQNRNTKQKTRTIQQE